MVAAIYSTTPAECPHDDALAQAAASDLQGRLAEGAPRRLERQQARRQQAHALHVQAQPPGRLGRGLGDQHGQDPGDAGGLLLAARIAAVPTTCTSLTPCSWAIRACAATIAASAATASGGIWPPSSGTRRRNRRTATTSRRRPSSRSATSRRVVLVPMSTHAQ